MENEDTEPRVIKPGALDMQVCVPHHWSDNQVMWFAQEEWPCGTAKGWTIRRQGHALLTGGRRASGA